MSKPYNFYEFSESGVPGSGIQAAYKGNESGFFTPPGLFDTPRGGFVFIGDNIDQYGNVPSYIASVSGAISDSNLDIGFTSLSFTGTFYPVSTETGYFSSSFTGSIQSGNIDSGSLISSFTGVITSGNIDSNTFYTTITGSIQPFLLDIPNLLCSFSGNLISGQFDQSTHQINLSGNIVGYERDNVSLDISFDAITFEKGTPLDTDSISDEGSMDSSISFICWYVSAC